MPIRKVELLMDDDDYRDLQKEITHRQSRLRMPDPDRPGRTVVFLPEGESDLAGAIVGEIVRDLWDYRQIWEAGHRPKR
jgi:hypothetical protein